jgi:hypothetical protein
MSERRQSFGGGTGRMGRSKSGHDDGNDGRALGDKGSMGIKEKEVGVVSDCNTQRHDGGTPPLFLSLKMSQKSWYWRGTLSDHCSGIFLVSIPV